MRCKVLTSLKDVEQAIAALSITDTKCEKVQQVLNEHLLITSLDLIEDALICGEAEKALQRKKTYESELYSH
jgi:hypothetical protein